MADITDRIIGAESSGNPLARNPRSSAGGLGQFIDSTFLATLKKHRPDLAAGKSDADLLRLKFDPALSREMTSSYASDNQNFLKTRGLPVNDASTYLAHFAGPAGAAALLANPGASVEATLGPAAVRANPFLRGMTGQDAANWAARKVDPSSAAMASTLRKIGTSTEGGVDPESVEGTGGAETATGGAGMDRLKSALGGYDPDKISMGQGLQKSGQKIGGNATNWLGALGGTFVSGAGGLMEGAEGEAKKEHDAALTEALTSGGGAQNTISTLLKSSDPAYRKAGIEMLIESQKTKPQKWTPTADGTGIINEATGEVRKTGLEKPQGVQTVAPGATIYDPNTRQPVYTAPAKQEGLQTVAPGSTVLDPNTRQPVFTAPAAAESTTDQRDYSFAMDQRRKAGETEIPFDQWIKERKAQGEKGNPISNAATLRKEFNAQSENYRIQLAGSDRVRIGAETDTPQGDIALVYGFMKMLDPGSVVREGEFATAETTGGVPDRIRILYNKALNGERLTPEMRKAFVDQADAQLREAEKRQGALNEQYTGIATRNSIDPRDVVTTYPRIMEDRKEAPPPGANPDQPTPVRTQTIDPATGQPAPAAPSAPAPAAAPSAPAAATPPKRQMVPPREAAEAFLKQPTPEMQQLFDKRYGAGAAEWVLEQQKMAPQPSEQFYGQGLF